MDEFVLFLALRKILGRRALFKCIEPLNSLLRKIAGVTHAWQLRLEWGGTVAPEWFNHFHDQYWQWRATRNPLWLERGVFSLLAIGRRAKVLELCCGDGFNSYHFYSIRAREIVAVDFGKETIAHAKKYNQAKNVHFQVMDIRKKFPSGKFDNVIWDAAIEHFTPSEIKDIVRRTKKVLTKTGILSGYTVLENETGKKMHALHEYEFKSKEDLARFFQPRFKNVKVFETDYPTRKNLYFFASDSILPFDRNWPWQTSEN